MQILEASMAGLALIYILVLAGLYLYQEKLIFYPDPLPEDFRFYFRGEFEEGFLRLGSLRIHHLIFRAERPQGVILYFHGNKWSLARWGEQAEELARRLSWDVWIMDYPGYGRSEGRIRSEKQLHELAELSLRELRRRYGADIKVVLFGRSLGSGLAVRLAAEAEVNGLVLETPYLSVRSLARLRAPWAPPFLLRYALRSDLHLPRVRCPVLILHGHQDPVIPFLHGKVLSGLAARARLVEMQSGKHNDLHSFSNYWPALEKFMQEVQS